MKVWLVPQGLEVEAETKHVLEKQYFRVWENLNQHSGF